jgi:hypothetical protein
VTHVGQAVTQFGHSLTQLGKEMACDGSTCTNVASNQHADCLHCPDFSIAVAGFGLIQVITDVIPARFMGEGTALGLV